MTLNELNFKELIELDIENVNDYTFDDYLRNGCKHPNISGHCIECDEKKINRCKEEGFCLRNISHGSKSDDFIRAICPSPNIEGWFHDGVMFVMESPSKDYEIYTKEGMLYGKHPSVKWYWIHNKLEINGYPQNFKGRQYGDFVASAIVTFRLANAYMTNLVKCGMNGPNNSYKGIDYYPLECIKTCSEKFFKREIEIVNPKIIFTFGSRVFEWVDRLVNNKWNNKIRVIGLPHPAGQRRGFKDEYYNILYFCMIAKGLYNEGIIDKQFYAELMERFRDN